MPCGLNEFSGFILLLGSLCSDVNTRSSAIIKGAVRLAMSLEILSLLYSCTKIQFEKVHGALKVTQGHRTCHILFD